mmetsp:Transcript_106279/g.307622  ORF Transcript_106279/g.307622 Transcript_106279/m.307622 type:complete len:224 (+) Transcript_106279:263-934(+)
MCIVGLSGSMPSGIGASGSRRERSFGSRALAAVGPWWQNLSAARRPASAMQLPASMGAAIIVPTRSCASCLYCGVGAAWIIEEAWASGAPPRIRRKRPRNDGAETTTMCGVVAACPRISTIVGGGMGAPPTCEGPMGNSTIVGGIGGRMPIMLAMRPIMTRARWCIGHGESGLCMTPGITGCDIVIVSLWQWPSLQTTFSSMCLVLYSSVLESERCSVTSLCI